MHRRGDLERHSFAVAAAEALGRGFDNSGIHVLETCESCNSYFADLSCLVTRLVTWPV